MKRIGKILARLLAQAVTSYQEYQFSKNPKNKDLGHDNPHIKRVRKKKKD